MAGLLQIHEPGASASASSAGASRRPPPPRPSWSAFLELGFRPLYLAGALWAAVSIALWVHAPALLAGRLPGVVWHAHEMLWGVVATIAVGFLMTAGTNWTGVNPIRGAALGALTALWIVARIGYLLPGDASFLVAAVAEVLFFVWAALALGRVVFRDRARTHRNDGLPLLLLGLATADASFLIAAWHGDYPLLMQRLHAGLLCMAVITLLIARRVIPFFATRAISGLSIPMHARSGQWQLAAGVGAIGCTLIGWPKAEAALLAIAGALALVQLVTWRPWSVRRVPLLWILYVGYGALGAGLIVAAAQAGGDELRTAWPVHVIGVGGFSVLIIGMITRTALGHLGRPLLADRWVVACYALIIAAAALRLAALVPGPWTLGALHASAFCWVLGFALYLYRFVPMLVRPRADAAGGLRVDVPVKPAKPAG